MKNVWAFCWGCLIGVLGGLIGLGGAEFRLPVLISIFKYRILNAIVINLIVSLVTVFSHSSFGLDKSILILSLRIHLLFSTY